MELKECQNIIGSCACKKQQEKIHIGTKRKIDFISSYTQSWSNKVLRYKPKYGRQSDGIVFIDCMSNSGLYCFQEEIIDGTSKRIQKIFDGQSKREYEDKDFILVVNDREIDKINCQYCIWDNSYSKRTNYEKRIFNKDVDDFLKTDGLNLLDEAKRKNYHILLFYDPYDIRFNWKFLKPFLEYPKCDVIITHFWSNDTIRAVGQVTKKDVKDKYEMAYNVKFEILENYFLDKSFYEKAQYLRERFVSVIKEMAPRKHVGYAPIFNKNNVVIYDILSISTSNKSRILLKDLLYSKYKDEIKGNSNEQIDLFSNVEDYEDYVDLRENGVSEKEYFYSTRHYANVITQQFIGSFLPVEEFKSFLLNHEFIPTNCKTDLKKDLKDFHDVREVKDETNKRTISGYDFREARL